MKKSTAVIAATSLGVLAAGGAAAAPASALPAVDCDDITDHVVTTGALDADWYMACVPQYGLGKAEFTIVSPDIDLPASLDLRQATVTSTIGSNVSTYLDLSFGSGAFDGLSAPYGVQATKQSYDGTLARPISSVAALPLTSIPTATCDATYTHAYAINFGAATTTFTQVIDGQTWTFPITTPASTLNVAFTPNTTTGVPSGAICRWGEFDPDQTLPTDEFSAWEVVAADTLTHGDEATFTAGTVELGEFVGTHVAVDPDPDPEPEPEPEGEAPAPTPSKTLPPTGVDATAPALAGGVLALLGAAGLLLARRRRSTR